MDKIIRISLGLFIVILVAFAGIMTYTAYTETAYRNTLTGTYTYILYHHHGCFPVQCNALYPGAR